MSYPTLSSCIIQSLLLGQMVPDLPSALLEPSRNKVRNRSETRHWDYKQELVLNDAFQRAEFAKDIVAFHNTDGGLIAVGITDDYVVRGIAAASILDTKQLRDKIIGLLGASVEVFQDSIEVPGHRYVWLIFIKKYIEAPCPIDKDGPLRSGRPVFNKGQYFYRDGDQVKLCRNEGDKERIFRGFSSEHLTAYTYEINEPYFRLLDPNCEKFIGRREKIEEIKNKLNLRHHVVALDGLGGVGKTAIALQAVRELYEDKGRYSFIVSLSAKSKVWLGYAKPRRAAFAGLRGLLTEIADVFSDLPPCEDQVELKVNLIAFMKGLDGLILIDNLEEIDDPGVLQFISDEIPAPVKVLVTSRIDKELGPRTIPIPEMTESEAEDLLRVELVRLGYPIDRDDEAHLRAILKAAGGVPLAIKWAAQIGSERRSLRDASSVLRGAGPGKQEFLSFCFATMFDALTDTAKDAARLIPYLDAEWKPMPLSIALDLPVDVVRAAIYELAEKGIIFRRREDRPDEHGVLPLTKDFLFNKFHESPLRRKVDERFSEMFSSDDLEGFLLEWPEPRRVEFLAKHARTKTQKGAHNTALTLVRLAQGWLRDADNSGAQLRFLEGYNLYQTGNRAGGIAHMRQAMNSDENDGMSLGGDDILLFAEALFSHGGVAGEREASEAVLLGVQKGGSINKELIDRVVESSIKRGEYRIVSNIVFNIHDGHSLSIIFDRLGPILRDVKAAYAYEREWATGLERLLHSVEIESEKKEYYKEQFGKILIHSKRR